MNASPLSCLCELYQTDSPAQLNSLKPVRLFGNLELIIAHRKSFTMTSNYLTYEDSPEAMPAPRLVLIASFTYTVHVYARMRM